MALDCETDIRYAREHLGEPTQTYHAIWRNLEILYPFVAQSVRMYVVLMEMDVWRGERNIRLRGYEWWDGFWNAAEKEGVEGLLKGIIDAGGMRYSFEGDGEGNAGIDLDPVVKDEENLGLRYDQAEGVWVHHMLPPVGEVLPTPGEEQVDGEVVIPCGFDSGDESEENLHERSRWSPATFHITGSHSQSLSAHIQKLPIPLCSLNTFTSIAAP